MLSISQSEWHGIGDGHGHLAAREVTVTVTNRMTGRPRTARLWLPDAAETVRRSSGEIAALRQATGLREAAG
jgi:hypothetical protein